MKIFFTKQTFASLLHLAVAIGILASCETKDKPVNPQDNSAGKTPGTPTEIGEPAGLAITRIIGKSGGEIISADGRTVFTFPAGALAKDTEITLMPVKSKVPGAFDSLAYVITPVSLKPALPVTITRTYSPEEISGTAAELVGIAFQDKQRIWQGSRAVKVDVAKRTLKAKIPSFEHPMAWYEQIYLTPASSLLTTNEECLIEIWYTQNRKETESNGLDPITDALIGNILERDEVRNWRVNGVLQGHPGQNPNAVSGHLNPENKGAVATYYAPKAVPPQNPVAISVELNLKGKGVMLLVGNFQIVSPGEMTINGKEYENIDVSINYSHETGGLFVALAERHEANAKEWAEVSVGVRDGVFQKGIFVIRDDGRVTMSATDGGPGDRKGSPWAHSYLPYDQSDRIYGPGSLEIHEFNDKYISGVINGTLHNSDPKDHRPIRVTGKFRTNIPR